MTALDRQTAYAGAAQTRTDVASRVTKALKTVFRAFFNRRHIGNLAELSDHHLADIGLLRSDLHQAARTGIVADPTATLASLRSRREEERYARQVC
jgi:uncharacterized protein YjiS (DUF1127 family)